VAFYFIADKKSSSKQSEEFLNMYKLQIKIVLIIFDIWLFASGYIAYEGQFPSAYLASRGMTQAEYVYPLEGVLFCIFLYTIVCINYAFLFLSHWSLKHPYLAYLAFSIVPTLMTVLAFLGAMHASSYWGAFIIVMLFIFLLHFLLVPVLIVLSRKKLAIHYIH